MDPFIAQLADLCRTHPTRPKWVLVPSHPIGHTVGERLAREGTPWANLLFRTPFDLALEAAAPFLVDRGIRPSGDDVGPALVLGLLRRLPDTVPAYFRPLASHFQMGAALWSAIRELRLAGIEARHLAPIHGSAHRGPFENPDKQAELHALLEAFERWLIGHGRADTAMVYREAIDRIAWCPIEAHDLLIETPDIVWAPLVRAFIDALPGCRVRPAVPQLPASFAPPRRIAKLEREARNNGTTLSRLMSDGAEAPSGRRAGMPPERVPPIEMFRAGGKDAEVEEVFRRVLWTAPRKSEVESRPSARAIKAARSGLAGGRNDARKSEVEGPKSEVGSRESEVESGKSSGEAKQARGSGGTDETTTLPLDQVEIACASEEYIGLVWHKAARYGWPVTVASGIPVTLTRPARALLAWCDWVESGYLGAELRRMFESGDVRLDIPDGPAAGWAARLLLKAGVTWGKGTYARCLRALATEERTRADDPENEDESRERHKRNAEAADRLLAWIENRLAALPDIDADASEPGNVDGDPAPNAVEAAIAFVDECATVVNEMDGKGKAAVLAALAELSEVGSRTSEVESRTSEGRSRTSGVASRTSEVESRTSEGGSRKSGVGSRKTEVGLPAVARSAKAGSRTSEVERRNAAVDALALVRAAVEGVTVGADRARPGHLHVSRLARAGFAGRPVTFIVGLEEGGVFPALIQDPVLLDSERRELHEALATSHDRLDEAVHAIVSRLAVLPQGAVPSAARPSTDSQAADRAAGGAGRIPARVCLSFSCRDVQENRETFPSWLLLKAARLVATAQGPSDEISFESLGTHLGDPVTVVGPRDRALSEGGWWLASLARGNGSALPALLRRFPSLDRGRRASNARLSSTFTAFDGYAPLAGAVLDPRRSGHSVSSTGIEKLASCPFAWFLEYGLRLEPIEEPEPDGEQWLDAATRGTELHALYAAVMRERRKRNQHGDPRRVLPWMTARLDERLAELHEEMPPPSTSVFDRERAELVRDCELFLRREKERSTGREPIAFEVGFGRAGSDEGSEREPIGQTDPVRIELGSVRFSLTGRIDRIDRVGPARYEIIDYKTGGYYHKKFAGTFRQGRMLQHALYSLAGEQLLEAIDRSARAVGGTYYFPSTRAGGQTKQIALPPRAAIELVMATIFDTVRSGAFLRSPDDDGCRFCKFGSACAGATKELAAAKLDNADNEVLEPLRRLRDTE